MQIETQTSDRRNAILRILRGTAVRRQQELVRILRGEGFAVTQSSISRDLRELGVFKGAGRYLPPADEAAARTEGDFGKLRQFVTGIATAGPSLTIVRTTTGAAQTVAAAIDKASWSEVVGTISGDDTIFIASATGRAQARIAERLRSAFRA